MNLIHTEINYTHITFAEEPINCIAVIPNKGIKRYAMYSANYWVTFYVSYKNQETCT